MDWQPWVLPTGQRLLIPADIALELPAITSLETEHQHFLVTLPWRDAYLHLLDCAYVEFFQAIRPYLRARTTDVHVAICFPFLKAFIDEYQGDERVVSLAFLLHDSGWSQMSDREIAASLTVPGLALSASAIPPKARHAILGRQLAMHVLEQEPPAFQLTQRQRQLIYDAILLHDQPWTLAAGDSVPIELKIVCDVDHLWSFTHENFWQDVIRKQVHPLAYASNLEHDLALYFVTEKGRAEARSLLAARQGEVEAWSRQCLSSASAIPTLGLLPRADQSPG